MASATKNKEPTLNTKEQKKNKFVSFVFFIYFIRYSLRFSRSTLKCKMCIVSHNQWRQNEKIETSTTKNCFVALVVSKKFIFVHVQNFMFSDGQSRVKLHFDCATEKSTGADKKNEWPTTKNQQKRKSSS